MPQLSRYTAVLYLRGSGDKGSAIIMPAHAVTYFILVPISPLVLPAIRII